MVELSFFGPPASNNGNVLIQEITGPGLSGTASQSYIYDDVNRLKTMAEAGGCAQLYSYDRYGSRAVVTVTGYCVPGTPHTPNLPADDPAQVEQIFPNNRWTGATHNLAGNQTGIVGLANWELEYDGENRVKQFTTSLASATYVYDGEGRRVRTGWGDGPRLLRGKVLLGRAGAVHEPGCAVCRSASGRSPVLESLRLYSEHPPAIHRRRWRGRHGCWRCKAGHGGVQGIQAAGQFRCRRCFDDLLADPACPAGANW